MAERLSLKREASVYIISDVLSLKDHLNPLGIIDVQRVVGKLFFFFAD